MILSILMRWIFLGVGVVVVFASFRTHASKKMNSDLATAWCLVGLVITLVSAIPPLSRWMDKISGWTGLALFCVGLVCLWAAFRTCLILSRLTVQNQELAMQVSLLLGVQQPKPQEKPAAGEGSKPGERIQGGDNSVGPAGLSDLPAEEQCPPGE